MAASPLLPNPIPSAFFFILSVWAVSLLQNADAGKTSSFVRKVDKAIDMPLDSDVFSVPPGFNAPQQYKVDMVFAGHVHAYERSKRISNIAYNIVNGLCKPVMDKTAPVYITIGDGGNLEGLATNMTNPQPEYSAFREASFGHAILDIKNRTHAYYSWHRNHDGIAVEADKMWFFNRVWHPVDDLEIV